MVLQMLKKVQKGFTLKHIGTILHAKLHQDFGNILDKVQVTLYTKKEDVGKLTTRARSEYKTRDERVEKMTDETMETIQISGRQNGKASTIRIV